MAVTHFSQLTVGGVPFPGTDPFLTRGNVYYVDPASGSDGNSGTSTDSPYVTLAQAYSQCVSGRGDVVVLLSALSAGTMAVAAAIDWAKDNTHLVGNCAQVPYNKAAKITQAAALHAATFFTVSGNNCKFYNIEWLQDDSTNQDNFALKVTGSQNYFFNCHIAGMAHATPAIRAGSRSLALIGPGGFNMFENCTVGVTNVVTAGANSQLALTAASPNNLFRNCIFVSYHTAAGGDAATFVLSGSGGMAGYLIFDSCTFFNMKSSTSGRALTAAFALDAASGGDVQLKNCTTIGCTDVIAGTPTNIWVSDAPPAAATSGLSVNPTA